VLYLLHSQVQGGKKREMNPKVLILLQKRTSDLEIRVGSSLLKVKLVLKRLKVEFEQLVEKGQIVTAVQV